MRERNRVLRPLTAAAVLTLMLPMASAAQPHGRLTAAAFAAELGRLAEVISNGPAGTIPTVAVPTVWNVEASGQPYDLPAGWLTRAIEQARRDPSSWPRQRAEILRQLKALQLEAQSLGELESAPRPAASAASARAELASVLAGPEFRQMARQTAMSRLRQAFSARLLRLWDWLGGGRLGRRGTAQLFAWIAALLALGVLATWLVRLMIRPHDERRLTLAAPEATRWTARRWAREALAASDPREAARFAYRSIVCRLEEEGLWRVDDTRTPREYLRLLPGGHRRLAMLNDVTRRFEEIWYGAGTATEDDRRTWLARLKELGCLPAD